MKRGTTSSTLHVPVRFYGARPLLAGIAVGVSALALLFCGPRLPPTTVPPPTDPKLESFRAALQAYVDLTQPYRKQAAKAADQIPNQKSPTASSEDAVRTRQNALANALRTKLRPNARRGEILVPAAEAAIRDGVARIFQSPKHDLLMDALAEQNDTGKASSPGPAGAPPAASDGAPAGAAAGAPAGTPAGAPAGARVDTAAIAINQNLDAPRIPPVLFEGLPPLPKQLEYDFLGRALLVRDIDADVVIDFLPDVLPVQPPAGVPTVPPPAVEPEAPTPLAMPALRGGTVFALIGDSGSGDASQEQVAQAMAAYFTTARRFPFVLMLGDNLYDDDYTGEFLVPYKPLLDRGVTFYATLGNHDRDLEQHFKPFNMQDRDYYSFDQGNARFACLNSNHPGDPAQARWLDTAFEAAGDKWRVCFFHHPLYSSGQHAAESRDVIRPALESALVRNHVDVVFTGHEHLYERVAPQRGIRYFVSGGGGRSLYDFQPSSFDEVGLSTHHYLVVEIAGDRLFFEAITPAQKLLDCGILYRTADAAARAPNDDTRAWLEKCEAGAMLHGPVARRSNP